MGIWLWWATYEQTYFPLFSLIKMLHVMNQKHVRKFGEGILGSVELNDSFWRGKGEAWSAAEPIITFLMTNGAPECLFLSNGTDDTVLNALIIYKAPLAQFWNPETQAPGFAVCGTDSKSIRDCWCSWFIVYEQGSFLPNKCLLWFINEIHSSFIFWENSRSKCIWHCSSGLIESEW